MRRFKSSVEAASETIREVFSRGLIAFDATVQGKPVTVEEYQMKELLGYTFTLTPQAHNDKEEMLNWMRQRLSKPHICKEYGEEWFQSMINAEPTKEFEAHMRYYPEYWSKFSGVGWSYSYAGRLNPNLKEGLSLLKTNPYRRGVLLQIYYPSDLHQLQFNRRIPCSVEYHPLIRRGVHGDVLFLIYHSRSMDLVNWFSLDLYRAMRLQEYIAEQLSVGVADLVTYVDSLHAYKVDVPDQLKW